MKIFAPFRQLFTSEFARLRHRFFHKLWLALVGVLCALCPFVAVCWRDSRSHESGGRQPGSVSKRSPLPTTSSDFDVSRRRRRLSCSTSACKTLAPSAPHRQAHTSHSARVRRRNNCERRGDMLAPPTPRHRQQRNAAKNGARPSWQLASAQTKKCGGRFSDQIAVRRRRACDSAAR